MIGSISITPCDYDVLEDKALLPVVLRCRPITSNEPHSARRNAKMPSSPRSSWVSSSSGSVFSTTHSHCVDKRLRTGARRSAKC